MEVVAVKSSNDVKTNAKTKEKSTSSDVFSEIIQSMFFQNVKQQDIQNKDLKKSGNEVNIKSIEKNISAPIEKYVEKLIQDIKNGGNTKDEFLSDILKLSEYTGKSSSEILTMLNGLNEDTKDGLNNNTLKTDVLQMIQPDNKLEAKGNDAKKLPSLNEIVDKMIKQSNNIADGNGNLVSGVSKDNSNMINMNARLDNIQTEISKNIASTGSNVNKISVTKDENGLPSANSKVDNIKAEISKNIVSDVADLKENTDVKTQTKDKVTTVGSNANKIITAKDEDKQLSMNSKLDNIRAEINKNIVSDVTNLKESADVKTQTEGTVTTIGSDANKIITAKDEDKQLSMNSKLDNVKTEISKDIASGVTNLKESTDAKVQAKDENELTSTNSMFDNTKEELSKDIVSDVTDLKEDTDARTQIKNTVTTTVNNANKISITKDENRQPSTNVKLDNIKPDINKDITADRTSLNKNTDAVIFADNAQSETDTSLYGLFDKNNNTIKDNANIKGINVISNSGNAKPQLDSKSDGSGKQSNLQMNHTAKLQNKIITPDLKDSSSSNFEKVLNMQSSDISQSSKTAESNKAESGYISSSKDLIDFTVRNFKTLRLPGFTELKLKLKPAELGEITIKVVLEKGQIDGVITAERKEVADMLNNGMDSLKQNLKNNNITFNNLNVNIDNSGNYGNDSSSRGSMYDGKGREHYKGSFESELEKKEKENEKGFSILA